MRLLLRRCLPIVTTATTMTATMHGADDEEVVMLGLVVANIRAALEPPHA